MDGQKWFKLVAWVVTFGLVTWWVATEGQEDPGIAAAIGVFAGTAVVYGITRMRS